MFSTSTPLLHCPFDGDDEDKASGAHHLTPLGTPGFGPGATKDGRLARVLNGLGYLGVANAAHNALFSAQEITVIGRFRTNDATVVLAGMYSPTSGAEADNRAWFLVRGASTDGVYRGGLAAGWEYGAGSTVFIRYGAQLDRKLSMQAREWMTIALRKKELDATHTQLDLWVGRHKNFPTTVHSGNDSTGGANTLFRVGGLAAAASLNGAAQDLIIYGSALSDAAIEAGIIAGGE